MELQSLSIKNLLHLQAAIISELKARNVVRTKNNPLGDYVKSFTHLFNTPGTIKQAETGVL